MKYLLFFLALIVASPVALAATADSAATSTTAQSSTAGPGSTAAAATTGTESTAAKASPSEARYWKEQVRVLFDQFIAYLPHLVTGLIILLIGWWSAGRIKHFLVRIMGARHVDATVTSFLSKLCYWLLLLIVLMMAAQAGHIVDTSPLTGMLAASTLAVGLALQNSLSNFAAGILIVFFRYFRVGDSIEAADVKGVVEEISIFDTHLLTADNRRIIVPNGKILGSSIINSSAKPTRRLDLVFNISYESNLKQAKQIVLTAMQMDIRVLPNPEPAVLVTNLGESAVDLTMRAWVAIGDYEPVRSHLLEEVKMRFDEAGVSIPYPQHEVHVRPAP